MKNTSNKLFVPIFLIIVLLAIIAGVFFCVDYYFFEGKWLNGDSWLSIIICLISSCATLILGYISYWQNKKQREDNVKAQELIQKNAEKEAQNIQRQRKLEVLVKNFDKYRDKLETIHAEIQKFQYASAILKVSKNVIEPIKHNETREEVEKRIEESNEIIENIIISLNYIENTVVYRYNKYFIDYTEPLILSIVKARHAIEIFAFDYLRLPLQEDEKLKNEKFKEIYDDHLELHHKFMEFETAWHNYIMKIIEHFERLEYNGNPEDIILEMKQSYSKIQRLRVEINNLENEYKKYKVENFGTYIQ